jgi:hypothetical protein
MEKKEKEKGKLTALDDKTEKLTDPYGKSKDFQLSRRGNQEISTTQVSPQLVKS